MKNCILKKFKLTCEDTSPLISESMDHRVPFLKRMRLKIHLAMCEVCMYYKKQLETIRILAQNLGREDTGLSPDVELKPDTKEKLKKMIEARE